MTVEEQRVLANASADGDWRRWGPYLSERSWGTVREDYSSDGDAWGYFTHDQARSKAYRWGEDGIGGFCDRYQLLCLSMAFWNGRDQILKERLFGVTSNEGNHGEDVKEYYFYLDSTPTHSYAKCLYKYPQRAYPYQQLVEQNRSLTREDPPFSLLDSGLFDDDRYFDIFIEYAKAGPEDLCLRITAHNRGPDDAPLHIIPNLWFRNTWGWGSQRKPTPLIRELPNAGPGPCLSASDANAPPLERLPLRYQLGERVFYGPESGTALFTDNETDFQRLYGCPHPHGQQFFKDAFHRHIVCGENVTRKDQQGTRAALHYQRNVPAGGSVTLSFRLSDRPLSEPLADIDMIFKQRRAEADAFYANIHPGRADQQERDIQRQAFAGLMWSKQNYIFDVDQWLSGDDPKHPPPSSRLGIRNQHWRHLNSMRILSMPDCWEYPWFAAWDLAFHAVSIALIDREFAKEQLWLMLFEQFQHPNGQIPAYEWEFSDLNPPVLAWAVWRVYNMDRIRSGHADRDFLERCFHKLLINFTWWINKVDSNGNNVFEGGFLGLDNIAVIDRSEEMPDGAVLSQSDATGWMGMFCQNLMRIALELAKQNSVYEGLATKFFQHYIYIGAAMKQMSASSGDKLWDDEDQYFYDILSYPDGRSERFRIRSLVGLVPLYAVERLEHRWIKPFEEFSSNFRWFIKNRRDIVQQCVNRVGSGDDQTHVLTIVDQAQLTHILAKVWDPGEFRSRFGLRSLSRHHLEHPFRLGDAAVGYEPGEAICNLKGGNSNWRGPIWFPTTFLMIETLRKLDKAYGDDLSIPSADGATVSPGDMAQYFADALIDIFKRDKDGRRPLYGDNQRFQNDPHWRDYILFHEYFHGDDGHGLGASHQTGWTALVANLIDEWRRK